MVAFRWAFKPQFGGRIHRLFDVGHRAEDRLADELRGAGVQVIQQDQNGEQYRFKAVMGHFGGSMDGCAEIDGEWHVIEFKTHSDKSFKDLEKKEVQESKPQHYAQMQVYMGLSGMKKALYVAENKNTSALYIERVDFNSKHYEEVIQKAEEIIRAVNLPRKWVEPIEPYASGVMRSRSAMRGVLRRRTAGPVHATPVEDGKWLCKKTRDSSRYTPKRVITSLSRCSTRPSGGRRRGLYSL